jgi:hypothetical protein
MNRRRIIVISAAVALALVTFLMLAFWPGEQEPEYQGKKLSEWLEMCRSAPFPPVFYNNPRTGGNDLVYNTAADAVRHIGTNAVPLLIKWLDIDRGTGTQMYRLTAKFPAKVREQRILASYLAKPYMRFAAAQAGFEILGPQAVGTIPELARMIERPKGKTSQAAVNILYIIGQPTYAARHAVLQSALHNPKADRISILQVIENNPDQGSQTSIWVAALMRCVNDEDSALAVESVKAIQSIGEWGAYYINELHQGSHLYGWGSPFKATVLPALKGALDSKAIAVRVAATNAVLKVAPELLLSEWELREMEARGRVPPTIRIYSE